jgi:hypothetical protein
LGPFVELANDIVAACAAGDAEALGRVHRLFGKSFDPGELRAAVTQKLASIGGRPKAFWLTDVQLIVARQYGFESWPKFAECVARPPDDPRAATHEGPRPAHTSLPRDHAPPRASCSSG